MMSHLFFSQLVLFVLLWLFIILHFTWPQRAVTVLGTTAQPEPLKPTRPLCSAEIGSAYISAG
jgi:hypothetical protein